MAVTNFDAVAGAVNSKINHYEFLGSTNGNYTIPDDTESIVFIVRQSSIGNRFIESQIMPKIIFDAMPSGATPDSASGIIVFGSDAICATAYKSSQNTFYFEQKSNGAGFFAEIYLYRGTT